MTMAPLPQSVPEILAIRKLGSRVGDTYPDKASYPSSAPIRKNAKTGGKMQS